MHTYETNRMLKKIFILEDNDDLRELYLLILEDQNYDIQTFASVSSFNQSSRIIPNLYLLDVMFPVVMA